MEKRAQEGKSIYVESILNVIEYKMHSKQYPNTYGGESYRGLNEFELGGFKWRYRMGETLSTEETHSINKALDKLMRDKVLLNQTK